MEKNKKFIVRQYKERDISQLLEIQRECFPFPFPADQLWNSEQLLNHIAIFPAGALCVEHDGLIIASSTSLIIDWDEAMPPHTWAEVSDNGYINTHNPNGNTLYGIDIAVRPAWRRQGVAELMYKARFELVEKLGSLTFLTAGRLVGYHCYKHKLSAKEYVNEVVKQNIIDPVITPQLRAGLVSSQLIPNYIDDKESCNFALLLEYYSEKK